MHACIKYISYVHAFIVHPAAISSSTLLIGYYHGLLLKYIDSNILVNKMYSNGLLTAYEEELILTGHSMHQRNLLLLGYVRHMQTVTLMIFCDYVQESIPRIGSQLIKGMQAFYPRVHTVSVMYLHTLCITCLRNKIVQN